MQQQRTLRRAQRESDAGNPQVTPRLARPRRTTFETARGDSSIPPLQAESRAVPMAQDGCTSCAEANRRPIEASKTSTALASAWAGSSHYRNPLFRHSDKPGADLASSSLVVSCPCGLVCGMQRTYRQHIGAFEKKVNAYRGSPGLYRALRP